MTLFHFLRTGAVATALTAAAGSALLVTAAPVNAHDRGDDRDRDRGNGRVLTAALSGANEVPTPDVPKGTFVGDRNGRGLGLVAIRAGRGELCFRFDVKKVSAVVAAHLHEAPAGKNGPVVVPLYSMPAATNLTAPDINRQLVENCIEDLDEDLLRDIKRNPADYYFNVHTTAFPGGAVRAQLSR